MRSFCLVVYFFCALYSWSISAYPYPVRVSTGSGYTYITMCGNEHMKYALTSDGYTILQGEKGWCFACVNEKGEVIASPYAIEEKNKRSSALNAFLRQQKKGIIPNVDINKNTVSSMSRMSMPVLGNRKALVVLMEFKDVHFSKKNIDFEQLFNEQGYSVDGASGSVYDYYKYVSYGQLDLKCTVLGPFMAEHDMAYYGANWGISSQDRNPYALFEEALSHITSQVNLSDFDLDNDGYVDNIHIIYAGYGEESGGAYDAIWAHEQTFKPISVDGLKIDRYSCAPELRENRGNGISRIGPHCHEIGHALGAMDFYDTDYNKSGGNYIGTGNWDVMANGSWNDNGINPANFNPYVKAYIFGWSEVVELNEETELSIKPSSFSNIIYRINTPVENEFFLLENRVKESFDSANPGDGLLIYHIGPNIDDESRRNTINSSYPQQCYVVCASSTYARPSSSPSSYGQINSEGCPYPGSSDNHSFSPVSSPSAVCLNGESCNFALNNITYSNKNIILSYSFDTSTIPPPDDVIPEEGRTIWTEDFSGNNIDDYWAQTYENGLCDWKRSQVFDSNGKHYYMELKYGLSFGWFERLYSATSLITELPALKPADYILSFDSKHVGDTSYSDSMKIYIQNEGNPNWELVLSKTILSDSWTTNSVLFHTESKSIKLCLTGVVHRQAGLNISNIVLKETAPTIVAPQSYNTRLPSTIYTLSGRCVSEDNLSKGFYIIKTSQNKVIKIVVR